jgi:hypothetical protein
MWLYVPSVCSAESEDWISQCESLSQALAPSAMSRGKRLQPRYWLRACRRDRWMQLLSGATCAPSTVDHGVAQWISSLEASPARTSATLASDEGSTESGLGSGGSTIGSCERSSHDGSSLRMSRDSQREDSEMSLKRYPISGMIRSGVCSPRPKLGQATGEGASSSSRGQENWATCVVSHGKQSIRTSPRKESSYSNLEYDVQEHCAELSHPLWSTVTATSACNIPSSHGLAPTIYDHCIEMNSHLWPTVCTRDHRSTAASEQTMQRNSRPLSEVVGSFHLDAGHSSGAESRPSLNPVFTEWMMGWPVGWTAFEPVEMESWLSRARQHLLSWLGEQDSTS